MKRIRLKKIMAGPDGSRQPGEHEVSDEVAEAICANPEVAELVDVEEVPDAEPEPEKAEAEPEVIETTEASDEDREEAVKPRKKRRRRRSKQQ